MTKHVAEGKAEQLNAEMRRLKLRPLLQGSLVPTLVSSRSPRAAEGWILVWSEQDHEWKAVELE